VRLTGDELGGQPTVVAGGPEPDDLADRFDVGAETVLLARFLPFHCAGVTRRHGVDEHQVTLGEKGVRIVDEPVGRRFRCVHVTGDGPAWAEHSHVQPYAGGSGAAVEGEGDWSGPGV